MKDIGSRRRDSASLFWVRGSGEGAAGEGASGEGADGEGADGEGADGEGAQGGGAQGQGAQGEGADGQSGSDESAGDPNQPPSQAPSTFLGGSDGSDGVSLDRPDDEVSMDDSDSDDNPASQEVLELSQYTEKGQTYYDQMMGAIHRIPKVDHPYPSINDRYRLKSETRSPLDPDPSTSQDDMAALLHLEPLVSPPEIAIDLNAGDWTFQMLTAKGQAVPDGGDIEEDATIITYSSVSQKSIIVPKSDSVTNDIAPDGSGDKLPNSELIFQLLQLQSGNAVSDTRFIIRHAITQKGTLSVLKNAHESNGLGDEDMGTWTAANGDVFRQLLGTRNGRPAVFMLTDHPGAMNCKAVIRIFTWAQIPGDPTKPHGAMVMEMGPVGSC